jgi:hypothetical protein
MSYQLRAMVYLTKTFCLRMIYQSSYTPPDGRGGKPQNRDERCEKPACCDRKKEALPWRLNEQQIADLQQQDLLYTVAEMSADAWTARVVGVVKQAGVEFADRRQSAGYRAAADRWPESGSSLFR